ncbi:MAG TPA: tetratricopeptide repeat protein [Bryobacteraceae bacterium]|nr:tetratricopeptide repeat protein [Bryobacteraceae bacterium]
MHKPPARVAASPRPRVSASLFIFPAIFAAALIAYGPALQGGLVWDDNAHVTTAALRSFRGLWRIWFSLGATQQYYPLLHSAFWLEHHLWGDAVLGYHLVNLAQHATAACLVVLIVRRLALPGAWLAGLVFALHPVCVESVAWISEQKSTLSAVFYLSSALIYLGFDRTRRRSTYLWATALFLCALLTKTVTATLPAALLVVFWWKRGRLDLRRDVRPLLPWFAIAVLAGLFTAWVERTSIGAQGPDFAIAPLQRLLIAGRVPWFYAAKLFWPVNLMFTYPRWNIDPAVWWQWLFLIGLLAAFVLAAKRRAALAALLFFVGTLFPVLGFLNVYPFRFSWVADHFQYLACLGIIVPVVGQAGRLPRVVNPLLLFILAILTFRQAATYADAETLYRATLTRNPASWMAHNNLGVALAKDGRTPDAIAEYQTALRLKPDYAEPHNNLATILSREPGRMPEAIAEAREALRLKPRYPEALVNLGSFLAPMPGRLPEAIAAYHAALRIKPDHAEAHNDLGLALLEMPGRLPDAVAELEAAVQLEPDNAQMHDNLAGALARMPGRLPEAIAQVQAAIEIAPGDPQAHDFLGRALSQMPGRLPDAISEFETALRLAPGYAQAHNDLGVVLLYVPGRRAEAVAEFRAALAIDPHDPRAQSNLQRALSQP